MGSNIYENINTPSRAIYSFYTKICYMCDSGDEVDVLQVLREFTANGLPVREVSLGTDIGARKFRIQIGQLFEARCRLEEFCNKLEDQEVLRRELKTLDHGLESFKDLLESIPEEYYLEKIPDGCRKPDKPSWWNWR